MSEASLHIPYDKTALVAEIHRTTRVLSESHDESGSTLRIRGFQSDLHRLTKMLTRS